MTFDKYFNDINTLLKTLTEIFEKDEISERTVFNFEPTLYRDAFSDFPLLASERATAFAQYSSDSLQYQKKPSDMSFDDAISLSFPHESSSPKASSDSSTNTIIQAVESRLKKQLSAHSGGLYDI